MVAYVVALFVGWTMYFIVAGLYIICLGVYLYCAPTYKGLKSKKL
jgi:hypothetical protein